MAWWYTTMSRGVMRNDCFVLFKVKVTAVKQNHGQNMTFLTDSAELLTFTQPKLLWWCIIIKVPCEKTSEVFRAEVTQEVQNFTRFVEAVLTWLSADRVGTDNNNVTYTYSITGLTTEGIWLRNVFLYIFLLLICESFPSSFSSSFCHWLYFTSKLGQTSGADTWLTDCN